MSKLYILVFVLIVGAAMSAQDYTLSTKAEISILTIGPGDQLYDKFGHSAFRVRDLENDIDIAYNYGVFDFDTPNFYLKFAQGKLNYKLEARLYEPFLEIYKGQNRWVKEQILNLSYSEKQALFNFLENNRLPENKYYQYDFFFDNCATKIRDVLVTVLKDRLVYSGDHLTENYTFRQLIGKNVSANSWGSLGMDVAIGAVVDRNAVPWEYQFLPQYIFEGAANATINQDSNEVPLVRETINTYENTPRQPSSDFLNSPLFVFGIISLLILFITYKDYSSKRRSRYLDGAIFFITGIVGILLLFLWFGTEHSTTANNYNILWAFPLSVFFTISIIKKNPKKWVRRYIIFLVLAMLLLLIHWITGVQIFAIGLIPLLIAIIVRYLYLIYFFEKN